MKLNWGTSIALAFVAFVGFILYFVITMSVDKTYSHDLVTEKYYQKELRFQDDIDAQKNASSIKEKMRFIKTAKGLEIQFPTTFKNEEVKGKVFLYRPSNKQLDFEMPISLSKSYLLVPDKRLVDGRWNITISWIYNNKPYLLKKEINI
jgi:nitrogen fixation protein FixH